MLMYGYKDGFRRDSREHSQMDETSETYTGDVSTITIHDGWLIRTARIGTEVEHQSKEIP